MVQAAAGFSVPAPIPARRRGKCPTRRGHIRSRSIRSGRGVLVLSLSSLVRLAKLLQGYGESHNTLIDTKWVYATSINKRGELHGQSQYPHPYRAGQIPFTNRLPAVSLTFNRITMNTLVFDIETIPDIEGGRKL